LNEEGAKLDARIRISGCKIREGETIFIKEIPVLSEEVIFVFVLMKTRFFKKYF